jgi:hypothetical protein
MKRFVDTHELRMSLKQIFSTVARYGQHRALCILNIKMGTVCKTIYFADKIGINLEELDYHGGRFQMNYPKQIATLIH